MEQDERQNERQRPKRAKPQQRNSRAAQAAEQRRQDRRERERLEALREKQKRKAKHRTRKRISSVVWKRILIMAAVVLAFVLSMIIFFRVRNIEVSGSMYYTDEEIISACGIARGDNLLTISRAKAAGSIMAELPYIRSVQVTRHLPDTLELTVTEYEVTYAVRDTQDAYYLVTSDGKITEQTDAKEAKTHIAVNGFTIASPVVGQQITIAAGQGQEVTSAGQLDAMTVLLQELEAADLSKEVASVEIPSSYDLGFWYGDQYYVKLGNKENLAYKLEYLKEVLKNLDDYQTGTIDLSFSEGNEARFTPNK